MSIRTYFLEMTKRGGIGPFAAAAALPGDDEEGTENGSNGDADDDAVLGEHCAGFWLYRWVLLGRKLGKSELVENEARCWPHAWS